jgi:hypothetical protein
VPLQGQQLPWLQPSLPLLLSIIRTQPFLLQAQVPHSTWVAQLGPFLDQALRVLQVVG